MAPRVSMQWQRTITWDLARVNLPHWPLLEHLGFSPGIWRDTDGPTIFKYASSVSENSGTDPGNEQCTITYHVTCSPFFTQGWSFGSFCFLPNRGHLSLSLSLSFPLLSLPHTHKGQSLFYIIAQYKWKWGNSISDQVNKHILFHTLSL